IFESGLLNGKSSICVTMVDDGKGIDVEALSKKHPEIQDMNSAIQYIALGGLSSRDSVSEFSGRGVGVSAVIQKVVAMGGKWEMTSSQDKGTILKVWIPLDIRTEIRS